MNSESIWPINSSACCLDSSGVSSDLLFFTITKQIFTELFTEHTALPVGSLKLPQGFVHSQSSANAMETVLCPKETCRKEVPLRGGEEVEETVWLV